MLHLRKTGFTLLELMAVATIIAVLAAIAIPNFLQAQVRARVARSNAEMAFLAIALESYYDDHCTYPLNTDQGVPLGSDLHVLTTPVRYYSRLPFDPFGDPERRTKGRVYFSYCNYDQVSPGGIIVREPKGRARRYRHPRGLGMMMGMEMEMEQQQQPTPKPTPKGYAEFRAQYILNSNGPDFKDNYPMQEGPPLMLVPYDPTNGTTSIGDVYRLGPQ